MKFDKCGSAGHRAATQAIANLLRGLKGMKVKTRYDAKGESKKSVKWWATRKDTLAPPGLRRRSISIMVCFVCGFEIHRLGLCHHQCPMDKKDPAKRTVEWHTYKYSSKKVMGPLKENI